MTMKSYVVYSRAQISANSPEEAHKHLLLLLNKDSAYVRCVAIDSVIEETIYEPKSKANNVQT